MLHRAQDIKRAGQAGCDCVTSRKGTVASICTTLQSQFLQRPCVFRTELTDQTHAVSVA